MPKKSKSAKGKKRASTGISINIKNVLKQNIGNRTRQTPDFIRPLGQRPIESQAYDNRYRLLNPSVTYMSTPLSNMPSLRDIVNAPALPQVSGEPRRLRADIQPVEVNPNDITQSRPARVAIKGEPVPTPAGVGEAAIQRYRDAELALRREELRLAKREELMGAANPIIGQRLEPPQADASQLLVALQADPRARDVHFLPSLGGVLPPLPSGESARSRFVTLRGNQPGSSSNPELLTTAIRFQRSDPAVAPPRRPKVGGAGDA